VADIPSVLDRQGKVPHPDMPLRHFESKVSEIIDDVNPVMERNFDVRSL
jgi:hypothetical protein